MKMDKLIPIVVVLTAATVVTTTTAFAGGKPGLNNDQGIPQQIQVLQDEVDQLQSNAQTQSQQITSLNDKVSKDEDTISQLQSTISKQQEAIKSLQSNNSNGSDISALEKEVSDLMYYPESFNESPIPGTSDSYPPFTKIGTASDGSTIWRMNDYFSLYNRLNQDIPLSRLVSNDLSSPEITMSGIWNGDSYENRSLSYVSGTPKRNNEFSLTSINDTQFTIEFTTPSDLTLNVQLNFFTETLERI